MKIKLSKIFYALVAVVFSLTIAIAPATAAEVRLYRHSDFRGESQGINTGGARVDYIHPQLKNRVSSLRVPPGFKVTLTDDEGRNSRTFDRDTPYVGDSINDRADTYGITPDCIPGTNIC